MEEKWLNQAPPGELKDQLVGEYAGRISSSDPARGTLLALGMRDGPLRTKVLGQIGKNWKEEDPDAAAAFAKNHGLAK